MNNPKRITPTARQIKLEQEKLRLDKLEADMRRIDAVVKDMKRQQKEQKLAVHSLSEHQTLG